MAWVEIATPILRELIADTASVSYTDSRLEAVLLNSAHLICREISFDSDYTVSILASSISPDPSDDINFINLVSLKAAVITTGSEWKSKAAQAIVIKDGPSTIDTSKGADSLMERAKYTLDLYTNAKNQYIAGNGTGYSVSTPIGFYRN